MRVYLETRYRVHLFFGFQVMMRKKWETYLGVLVMKTAE